jgi:DtxR family transcriptional regulator, Mn-dependent transcriptional regulator
MLSDSTENYIKAIQALERRYGQASTKRIAQALSVTMPSVTRMIKRLAAEGLIEHKPYQGAVLTSSGNRIANAILRRHRLLEVFLHQTLDVPWDEVHGYAEKMEHAIDEHLTERIDAYLGFPQRDPHGSPIPQAGQSNAAPQGVPLDQAASGSRARLLEVPDDDPAFLRHLSRLNLTIGTEVMVDQNSPYSDSIMLRLDDRQIPLGRRMAAMIRVEPLPPGERN